MKLRLADLEGLHVKHSERIESNEKRGVWTFIGVWSGVFLTIIKLLTPATPAVIQAPASPTTSGNNIKIGLDGQNQPSPQRAYLTTKDVAEKEAVETRTVIDWIAKRRIVPAPERSGDRQWAIAADYRILPQIAESAETVNP